jgi:hypothetical protein
MMILIGGSLSQRKYHYPIKLYSFNTGKVGASSFSFLQALYRHGYFCFVYHLYFQPCPKLPVPVTRLSECAAKLQRKKRMPRNGKGMGKRKKYKEKSAQRIRQIMKKEVIFPWLLLLPPEINQSLLLC